MNYDNTNRGSIWGNDRKETETQPDFKGSINVEGKEYWLSAWKRKPDANPKAPALSISVQPKEEAQQQGMAQANAAAQPAPQAQASTPPNMESTGGSFEDDIPFAQFDKGMVI